MVPWDLSVPGLKSLGFASPGPPDFETASVVKNYTPGNSKPERVKSFRNNVLFFWIPSA
jgi:hypothetical protein